MKRKKATALACVAAFALVIAMLILLSSRPNKPLDGSVRLSFRGYTTNNSGQRFANLIISNNTITTIRFYHSVIWTNTAGPGCWEMLSANNVAAGEETKLQVKVPCGYNGTNFNITYSQSPLRSQLSLLAYKLHFDRLLPREWVMLQFASTQEK